MKTSKHLIRLAGIIAAIDIYMSGYQSYAFGAVCAFEVLSIIQNYINEKLIESLSRKCDLLTMLHDDMKDLAHSLILETQPYSEAK